jgi:hypothetical protein
MNRSAIARIGAYESWARTADRTARTAPALAAFAARFERQARERLGPAAQSQTNGALPWFSWSAAGSGGTRWEGDYVVFHGVSHS